MKIQSRPPKRFAWSAFAYILDKLSLGDFLPPLAVSELEIPDDVLVASGFKPCHVAGKDGIWWFKIK